MADTRIEKDSLGEMTVPAGALWGASTARAVENFPISGLKLPPAFIRAFARIKRSAADVSREGKARLKGEVVRPEIWEAIAKAADEVAAGKHDDEFVVDVYQAGAGTSFNMNVNEVLTNRALEILGKKRGDKEINPNDHPNIGQSTNDTIPTAMRLSTLDLIPGLLAALDGLIRSFEKQQKEVGPKALKSGRTHLQDAVPMRVDQEIGGWAAVLRNQRARLAEAAEPLRFLPIGGNAIGTGLNTEESFGPRMCARLSELTGEKLKPAPDRFALIASMADLAHLSGVLRNLAVEVNKVANDLRLLASGPFTGLAEVALPAVQPGSSIMPGKVNPSIPEMVNQVCYQVMGLDLTVSHCANGGQLELNVMMPVAAFDLCHMLTILTNAIRVFDAKCISGLKWDLDRCQVYFETSGGMATILNPHIGYAAAAEVQKEAVKTHRRVIDVIRERKLLDEKTLLKVLDPTALTEPRKS